MIKGLIRASLKQRLLVVLASVVLIGLSFWSALDLNLDAMSASDRGHAATVLREALNRLSALDQASTPGTQEAKQAAFAQDAPPKAE